MDATSFPRQGKARERVVDYEEEVEDDLGRRTGGSTREGRRAYTKV
jgi:hypothetical protein